MSTISIPFPDNTLKSIKMLVKLGVASNMSEIVRQAVQRFLEEEAVNAVLRASKEPNLKGNLDKLSKKL